MNTCGHVHSAVLSQLGYCVPWICSLLTFLDVFPCRRNVKIVPAEASKKGSSWEISDTPRDKDEEQSGAEGRGAVFRELRADLSW